MTYLGSLNNYRLGAEIIFWPTFMKIITNPPIYKEYFYNAIIQESFFFFLKDTDLIKVEVKSTKLIQHRAIKL
jgi:hypothetical protein